jgi:hypothetical protein
MFGDAANRLVDLVSKVALQTRAVVAGRKAAMRMRAALVAAIVVTLALALSTSARAATITVDSLADTGAAGICVLRDAITAANTMTATNGCTAGTGNDTIQFSVTGTISLGSTLPQITDGHLTINGPALPGITIDGGGQVQVMVVASGATLNLNDLTIADGLVEGDSPKGGGINNDGTLTVANSTFSGNLASGSFASGGGIFNEGTLTIINSIFSGNSAKLSNGGFFTDGGGISSQGRLTVRNSTFSANGALAGGAISGGLTLTIIKSTFTNNRGDAVEAGTATTIKKSIFTNNNGGEFNSGAIDNGNGGSLTITDSTFANNTSISIAGAISNKFGPATITNSTFSGNSNEAIENNQAVMNIRSSTFVDNSDYAIVNFAGLNVTNSTFVGHSRVAILSVKQGTTAPVTITNNTFAGNGSAIQPDFAGQTSLKGNILATSSAGNCLDASNITDAGFDISDDASCNFRAIGSHNNTNPGLDPAGLADNGGKTKTIAVVAGSPTLDAIPVAACTKQTAPMNPLQFDQRGLPRPSGPGCDIGAFEVQQ